MKKHLFLLLSKVFQVLQRNEEEKPRSLLDLQDRELYRVECHPAKVGEKDTEMVVFRFRRSPEEQLDEHIFSLIQLRQWCGEKIRFQNGYGAMLLGRSHLIIQDENKRFLDKFRICTE